MTQVRGLKESELKLSTAVSQEIGKEAQNPPRKLKLCTYEKRKNEFWYRVIVDIQEEEFQIFDNNNEENARAYFHSCCDIIPYFWSPRILSHLTNIFTVKVLTKLVELIEQHGNTWSIAHVCVSLPLPEETMFVLLTSDPFKDHFTSTCHPKGYRILHLAVELNSVSACRVIIRCVDQWPGFHDKAHDLQIKDIEGILPIQKAIICEAWACVDYLVQSLSFQPPSGLETPLLLSGEMFQRARNLDSVNQESLTTSIIIKMKAPFRFSDKSIDLHEARDPETIVKIIEGGGDPERRDKLNNTPLHTLVKAEFSDNDVKLDCIVALLAYGGCDPDNKTVDGKTALHLAVEAHDHLCASALIVFGAKVSMVNQHGDTPLDIAEQMGLSEIKELLQTSINYDTQQARICRSTAKWPPTYCRPSSYEKSLDCPADVSTKREVYIHTLGDIFKKFTGKIDQTTLHELLSCAMETFDYAVQQVPVGRRPRNGDRVLCLDGGGIRGLILIELLSCIEEVTGKEIIDLFDWFVGTSTGAILALALVYTNLSLHEMRCLYFKLKDEVFSEQLGPFPQGDTEAMERILKSTFGEYRKLGSKTYPKVLITATDVEYTPWQLVFYNNIEDGPAGKDAPIWMAARATSAAPAYFKQFGKHVDGGLKANNPSMSALTRIHQHYSDRGKKNYKISCMVSLGCGKFRKQTQPIDIRKATSRENFTLWRTVTLEAAGSLTKAVMNLFQALSEEVAESDGQPVDDARAFCETNKISYYRLSPDLNELKEEVNLDETNSRRLVRMLMLTKWDLLKETTQLHGIKHSTAIPLDSSAM